MILVLVPWGVNRRMLDGVRCEFVLDRSAFAARLPAADAGVIMCDEEAGADIEDWLPRLRAHAPLTPILCVAPLTHTVARALARSGIVEVVWESEPPNTLAERLAALEAVDLERLFRRLSAGVERAHPIIRKALREICDLSQPVVTSVKQLCENIAVPQSTFRETWSQEVPGCAPSLMVRWIVLLRALSRLPEHGSALAVATLVGVHESTLNRNAKLLGGETFLSHLDPQVVRRTLRRFSTFVTEVFPEGPGPSWRESGEIA